MQPTSVSAAQQPTLEVGFAKGEITPDVEVARPVWMAGYGQNRRATGVHDPLFVRALVLSDGRRKIALASVDLVGLQYPDVLRIRERLEGFDYVMVSSTHNHEGPDVIGIWGPNPLQSGVDPEYIDLVVKKTAECIRKAATSLQGAAASYGTAKVPAALLRDSRLPIVRDDVLRVVMFRELDGDRPVALLVQYSCHPESLGSRNTLITADFPAATIASLEQQFGCPIAYFTGAVGGLMSNPSEFTDDEGNTYQDGNFQFAEAYGRSIAEIASKAVETANQVRLVPLRIATLPVAAPLANPLYRAAQQMKIVAREAVRYNGDWREVDEPATADTPADQTAVKTEVACLALGEVTLAGIPGEIYPELVYGEYQQPVEPGVDYPEAPLEPSLIDSLQSDRTLIIGLANDEVGYIIPRRQWDQKPPFAYGRDKSQYGEVNSCGPDVAAVLMEALQEAAEMLRNDEAGRQASP